VRHLDFGRILGAAAVLTVAAMAIAPMASATPNPTSAIVKSRIFNDDPFSTLTVVNGYPASISITDQKFPGAGGFANRHAWRFSSDGTNATEFQNADHFRFCADLNISGTGEAEAGLQITPWWSLDVDGMFNVRTTDGEIAVFGGRLPFYSFTGSHGITYVKGTTIGLEMIYDPNGLSSADPATVEYIVRYNANTYSSGPLNFDEGNPSENPPHGVWGILQPSNVGGHLQYFIGGSGPTGGINATWSNVCYENLDAVSVTPTTWSNIKSLLR
jgi:hypothetical protein